MIDDVQYEVAAHLLANALRKRRLAAGRAGGVPAGTSHRRPDPADEYLRGMLDMLRALHGPALTDELRRRAQALEQRDGTA